jgi:hypothetical protein
MSILANHLPACKRRRDPVESSSCWNFDSSHTFRIPSRTPSHQSNNGVMEVDTKDIIDGDNAHAQSDCHRKDEQGSGSELQNCNFGHPGLRQEQKYSHFTNPTYMMANGYADSVCAVI